MRVVRRDSWDSISFVYGYGLEGILWITRQGRLTEFSNWSSLVSRAIWDSGDSVDILGSAERVVVGS